MTANRRPAWILAAILAAVATPGLACEPTYPAPRASPEVAAERVRNHQAEMWARSDAVFLSEAGAFERIALPGGQGVSATLIPALALKGDLPTERIGIRHSTVTSCGPIPFLDALAGREGDWFVTYVRRLPSGLSVDDTVPVADLVDEDSLRAWRKADPT
ncbi:hypothetical protein ACETK8_02435 [Brevundimonas staleyi]|uniref:Uncharacterized protein n=1 Tax=Brevundimonas staleyi TaxID=74326 RepID=A0ABW0FU57_9CAUL